MRGAISGGLVALLGFAIRFEGISNGYFFRALDREVVLVGFLALLLGSGLGWLAGKSIS